MKIFLDQTSYYIGNNIKVTGKDKEHYKVKFNKNRRTILYKVTFNDAPIYKHSSEKKL